MVYHGIGGKKNKMKKKKKQKKKEQGKMTRLDVPEAAPLLG